MNTANNRKFKDTEQKIEQALLSLSKTGPAHRITVRQICAEAQINRSTFYAHFQDIPDMIHKIGARQIRKLLDFFDSSEEDILLLPVDSAQMLRLLDYIKENRDFFDVLINNNQSSLFTSALSRKWSERADACMQRIGLCDETEMNYYLTFYGAGFLAVLGKWLSGGCALPSADICRILRSHIPPHGHDDSLYAL